MRKQIFAVVEPPSLRLWRGKPESDYKKILLIR
jgi:hypothetical protein